MQFLTNTRSRIQSCAAALLFILCAQVACAVPDYLTVRVEGYAEGIGFVPRQLAVKNAKQVALEQLLRNLTGLDDLRIFRPLLRHVDDYIPEHEELRHDSFGDGTSVEIDAHILEKPLQHDVATVMLPRLPEPPTVQVVVGQQLGQGGPITFGNATIAETTIVEGLNEHRVHARGTTELADRLTTDAMANLAQGSLADGAQFARSVRSDVVMVGIVTTEESGPDTPGAAHRHKATARLQVYRGSDGKVIDDIVSVAAMHGVDPVAAAEEAVRDACRKVVRDCLTAAVITVLGNQTRDKVLLTLHRPTEEARVLALELALNGDPQVGDLEILFYEEGLARMRFDYSGPMSHLVQQLDGAVVNGRKLTVDRVVGREMDATFQ